MMALIYKAAILFLTIGNLSSYLAAKELDLTNDDDWLVNLVINPPVKPQFKLYIFDWQNPEGFLKNNEKPVFKEKGPYVYRETFVLDNLKWLSDGVVEYEPKKIYRFAPTLSRPNRQTDEITTVNVPMLTALHQMKNGPPVLFNALANLLNILEEKQTDTQLVRQFIWGRQSSLLKLGRDVQIDKRNIYPYDKFGLFVGQNFTDRGTLRATTGLANDGSVLGNLIASDGKPGFGYWRPGSECDRVRGSEGFFFKSGLQKSDTIYLYNQNFCRTVSLRFEKEVDHKGIKGYRFRPSKDTFGLPRDFPENTCYCVDGSCRGIKSGLFNISTCQYGAPVMLTFPHFLDADASLRKDVVGLNPDPELHSSFIDVEPVTGITLRAKAGAQLNIAMTPLENVAAAEGLRQMTFPLAYFMDESNGLTQRKQIRRLKSIIKKRSASGKKK